MRINQTFNHPTIADYGTTENAKSKGCPHSHVAQEVLFQDELALLVPLIVDVRLVLTGEERERRTTHGDRIRTAVGTIRVSRGGGEVVME